VATGAATGSSVDLKKNPSGAGMTQVVEFLPTKYKALSQYPVLPRK
jgi:hypothetical protein